MADDISSCWHNCGSGYVPGEVCLCVDSSSLRLLLNLAKCLRSLAAFQKLS